MARQKITFTSEDDLLAAVSAFARRQQSSVRSLIRQALQEMPIEANKLGTPELSDPDNTNLDRDR
jgi:hypothetical protein